ncbi:uncharacterized protein NEMAJ01_0111 [Nematocida major]|uniref:uncharacterized protein n=1 Tax=Nematocida major TaxID=1912982 RepID=UPI00200747A0|nr:uncharacterized protein NEMAJ01_0111 [Nematocida major]KAH9385215.1 hypothetical protein NEMAJ01_0111 [Nematocida major]
MNEIRLYPIYFNTAIKRSQGRKVPAREGVMPPTFQQILKALNQLGIEYKIGTKQHPKHSYEICEKLLPAQSKPEEVERLFSTTGGCFTITTDCKRKLIKDIHEILSQKAVASAKK